MPPPILLIFWYSVYFLIYQKKYLADVVVSVLLFLYFRFVLFVSKFMVRACNAASAPPITMQCVRQGQGIEWRLDSWCCLLVLYTVQHYFHHLKSIDLCFYFITATLLWKEWQAEYKNGFVLCLSQVWNYDFRVDLIFFYMLPT